MPAQNLDKLIKKRSKKDAALRLVNSVLFEIEEDLQIDLDVIEEFQSKYFGSTDFENLLSCYVILLETKKVYTKQHERIIKILTVCQETDEDGRDAFLDDTTREQAKELILLCQKQLDRIKKK